MKAAEIKCARFHVTADSAWMKGGVSVPRLFRCVAWCVYVCDHSFCVMANSMLSLDIIYFLTFNFFLHAFPCTACYWFIKDASIYCNRVWTCVNEGFCIYLLYSFISPCFCCHSNPLMITMWPRGFFGRVQGEKDGKGIKSELRRRRQKSYFSSWLP